MNRRRTIYRKCGTCTLILLSVICVAHVTDAADRPNVVLIISDDQGWTDYGFMGHNTIQTPNLDQLAGRSLLFERGYVVAPLCRPSLASIATGLYPHQHGVCANDVDPEKRAESDRPVSEAFNKLPSMIKALVADGYLAFQTGKWWEGSWQDGGFTGGMTHGDPAKGGRHGDRGLKIGRAGMNPVTDFIDSAVSANKPFFIWYAPFLPHTPHNPPAELLKKYQALGRPANVAKYYAMCEWFDQTCGQLFDHLAKRKLTRNTILVYVCDNGWAPVDRAAENPKGWWPGFAPRSKGGPFEGGIRTPIMIAWPEHVRPTRSRDLASSIDLMPTVLRACGIDPPDRLPGIDLLDINARTNRDAIFGASYAIHNMYPGDTDSTLQYRWCIAGDWKLLLRHRGEDTTRYRTVHEWDKVPVRLFNLKNDPTEQANLAAAEADRVRRMTEQINTNTPYGRGQSADH